MTDNKLTLEDFKWIAEDLRFDDNPRGKDVCTKLEAYIKEAEDWQAKLDDVAADGEVVREPPLVQASVEEASQYVQTGVFFTTEGRSVKLPEGSQFRLQCIGTALVCMFADCLGIGRDKMNTDAISGTVISALKAAYKEGGGPTIAAGD
jgi:hypothetical protein